MKTEDYSNETAKQIGLLQNRKKDKIIYYNYLNLNRIQKIIYLIKNDRKKMRILLKNRYQKYIYTLKSKTKRKLGNNVILKNIVTILYRIIKLPYLYLKDIINIFKFDNKEG